MGLSRAFLENLEGSYDNFQQYWQENTDDERHVVKSDIPHRHIHIKIKKIDSYRNTFRFSVYEGRNNEDHLEDVEITIADNDILSTDDGIIIMNDSIEIKDDTLYFSNLGSIECDSSCPYKAIKCRFFSGWIEYPNPNNEEDIYAVRNLEIHDQGGAVELDVEGVDYTVELTQLVFAHKIFIMKLAIYDIPLKDLDINSKAISYTWTNPEAKRLGINLRKVISGWTLIESNMLNSNNLKS